MGRFGGYLRWWWLYQAIAFAVIIPAYVSYHVIKDGDIPKKVLLVVIPLYAILAWSYYQAFKRSKPN
jgi:hypothetical protein